MILAFFFLPFVAHPHVAKHIFQNSQGRIALVCVAWLSSKGEGENDAEGGVGRIGSPIYLKRNTAVFLRSHFVYHFQLTSDLVRLTRLTVDLVHGTVPHTSLYGGRLSVRNCALDCTSFLTLALTQKLYIGPYLLFCDFIIARFFRFCNMASCKNSTTKIYSYSRNYNFSTKRALQAHSFVI